MSATDVSSRSPVSRASTVSEPTTVTTASPTRRWWSSWRTTRCSSPGSSTPTCTSTSPAAPSGRGSPARPGRLLRVASRRSSTCRSTRSPPTTNVPALQAKRAAAIDQAYVDVGFWGGAVPGQPRRPGAPARRGCLRLQVLPAPLRRRRVPPPGPGRPRARDARDRPAGGAADRPRRGRARHRRRPPRRRAEYDGFLRSRPRGAENLAIAQVIDARPDDRGPRARAAPVERRRPADDPRGPCRRSAPSPSRPARTTSPSRPRRSPTAQRSSSAARRSARRPTASCSGPASPTARSTSSSPTTRRAPSTSSGSTPATSAWRGVASPACSSGCRRSGPSARRRGHTLADVVRWMATGPADAGRAHDQGPHRRRPRRRPRRLRPRRDVRRRPGRAAPQEPRDGVRRPRAHRGRAPDLAARHTDRPRAPPAAGAAAAGEDTHDDAALLRAPGRAARADRPDDRPGRLHRGVCRPAARHDA